MNPFLTMLEVLRLLVQGDKAHAAVECSPCPGASCMQCSGSGAIPLSSIYEDTPEWYAEAEFVLTGAGVVNPRSRVMRKVVLPMVRAHRILGDDESGGPRRFDQAREAVAACEAGDWRSLCENWIELVERGQVDEQGQVRTQ